MLIDLQRILEHKFSDVYPHLKIVAIEDIAIPVSKIDLSLLGEATLKINPSTEYVLRFVDLGISTASDVGAAMGISPSLALELISDEHRAGNLKIGGGELETLEITGQGKETLRTCLSRVPKNYIRSIIFDTSTWQVTSWPVQDFLNKKNLKDLKLDPEKLEKKSPSAIHESDISIVELNRIKSGGAKGERIDIQQIRRVIKRRHGFRLAKLLIYFDGKTESNFIIIVDGERSLAHETWLRSQGGLQSFGISPTPVESDELKEVNRELAVVNQIENSLEPDGGFVRPYDHPSYLQEALDSAKKRLLIFSPWVKAGVVNTEFLGKIELLLKRQVKVTIGWGFGNNNEIAESNHASALRKLLNLRQRYPDFQFIRLDNSHAKILIYDDVYIATSFNWLSYKGEKYGDSDYRNENGEMRTAPAVVNNRYVYMIEEATSHGKPMTNNLIPRINDNRK
jgi:hypothetical protein